MTDVRALAASQLAVTLSKGGSFNGEIVSTGEEQQTSRLSSKDQAFYRELVFGTLRHFHRLDAQLQPLLKKPLGARDADIHALLLLGAYQLQYLRTPDHAAINATVNAARSLKKKWACGLLNAVLRKIQRNRNDKASGPANTPNAPDDKSSAADWSHPDWLLKKLQTDWPEQWQQIASANNQRPIMALRVNLARQSRDEYLRMLEQADISAVADTLSNSGVLLDKPSDITALPGFAEGQVSVQDCGAQLAASLLPALPGQRLLDACAAPGGKACHLLETFEKVLVTALDIDSKRSLKVSENCRRLGLAAEIITADGCDTGSWWDGEPYQHILLDAPCSGSGVISHHPDIKLLRRGSDIEKFASQQLALLNNLWPLLAPGGSLLYCTCSIFPEENDQLVDTFIQTQADAEELPIDASWGTARPVGRQLLPNRDKNDGFFYARLSKSAAV